MGRATGARETTAFQYKEGGRKEKRRRSDCGASQRKVAPFEQRDDSHFARDSEKHAAWEDDLSDEPWADHHLGAASQRKGIA